MNDDDKNKSLEALNLPDTVDLAAVDAAEVEVIRLVAQGRLKPREALYMSRMLEYRRRAIGDVVLEDLMNKLEEEGKQPRGGTP